ncbi:MAG: hypothetical protein IJA49_00500 [Oscillospiraceae bacterium]|nr:hypothetical protein [Oscillospiraceae bacterium]
MFPWVALMLCTAISSCREKNSPEIRSVPTDGQRKSRRRTGTQGVPQCLPAAEQACGIGLDGKGSQVPLYPMSERGNYLWRIQKMAGRNQLNKAKKEESLQIKSDSSFLFVDMDVMEMQKVYLRGNHLTNILRLCGFPFYRRAI